MVWIRCTRRQITSSSKKARVYEWKSYPDTVGKTVLSYSSERRSDGVYRGCCHWRGRGGAVPGIRIQQCDVGKVRIAAVAADEFYGSEKQTGPQGQPLQCDGLRRPIAEPGHDAGRARKTGRAL